jgi:hypothetical protein
MSMLLYFILIIGSSNKGNLIMKFKMMDFQASLDVFNDCISLYSLY